MALHINELNLPFKRYHIDKVWRGENTQKGRYREFIQCDFDIVGLDNASADFEILQIIHNSFKALEIDNITIKIAHRGIFNNFLANINASDKAVEIMRTVDKISKIGRDKVFDILKDLTDLDSADKILEYIEPGKDFSDTLKKIITMSGGKSESSERLWEVYEFLLKTGIENLFQLDGSLYWYSLRNLPK
jgi:histidyl-tRNA synthetase